MQEFQADSAIHYSLVSPATACMRRIESPSPLPHQLFNINNFDHSQPHDHHLTGSTRTDPFLTNAVKLRLPGLQQLFILGHLTSPSTPLHLLILPAAVL